MSKEDGIFNSRGGIRRPTEELALAHIAREERRKREIKLKLLKNARKAGGETIWEEKEPLDLTKIAEGLSKLSGQRQTPEPILKRLRREV